MLGRRAGGSERRSGEGAELNMFKTHRTSVCINTGIAPFKELATIEHVAKSTISQEYDFYPII